MLDALSRPFRLDNREVHVTASIGVSVYPEDGDTSGILLKHADAAMYLAKEMGRNGYQFYTREMGAHAQERAVLENALWRALEREEFELYYQPQVDLISGRVTGMEALLRWRQPELGMVSPARFIPVAEATGLIVPIGEWVLRTACAPATAWDAAGYAGLSIAVNLSAVQFHRQDVPALVRRVIDETGLPASRLDIELTESTLMQDKDSVIRKLHQLKTLGVTLSMDDFGTGYSSLSYLRRFALDVLKIDQSFIADLPDSKDAMSLTKTIIAMAGSLGLKTIAEGVETEGQLAFLSANGCDAMQGYYFSRPLPVADMAALLRDGKRLDPGGLLSRKEPHFLV